jgi:hypothetical protein
MLPGVSNGPGLGFQVIMSRFASTSLWNLIVPGGAGTRDSWRGSAPGKSHSQGPDEVSGQGEGGRTVGD